MIIELVRGINVYKLTRKKGQKVQISNTGARFMWRLSCGEFRLLAEKGPAPLGNFAERAVFSYSNERCLHFVRRGVTV